MSRSTKTDFFKTKVGIKTASSRDATITIARVEMMSSVGSGKNARNELIEISAQGVATRGPKDKSNRGVGETLALARALEGLSRKLRKELEGYV